MKFNQPSKWLHLNVCNREFKKKTFLEWDSLYCYINAHRKLTWVSCWSSADGLHTTNYFCVNYLLLHLNFFFLQIQINFVNVGFVILEHIEYMRKRSMSCPHENRNYCYDLKSNGRIFGATMEKISPTHRCASV